MRSLKRRIADFIERVSGAVVISSPNSLHLTPERVHLRRFFAYFGVDCVFDVGANEGQYATMLREAVGFKGPIISYEPIPEIAEVLKAKSSVDRNWYVVPLALDREAGPAMFNVMVGSQCSSLLKPSGDQLGFADEWNVVRQEMEVMRTTIAVELPRWQAKLGFKRPYLKMDTQGNDLAVVEGAGDALRSFVGLQSELAIRKLYEGATGFAETIEAYRGRGFELSALVPNNAGTFPILVEIDCVMFRQECYQHIVRVTPVLPSASGEHRAAVSAGRSCSLVRLAQGTD
jgi:FkbM family methyltransferase